MEPFGGQHAEPFHVTAALKFRWDALQTARTNTTEEDMLHELLGLERTRKPRTELSWLRVDVTLRASIVWGREIPLPAASAWQRWARETLSRLERLEPVIPFENVRERRNNLLPEILAWQSVARIAATARSTCGYIGSRRNESTDTRGLPPGACPR